mmetsp:Transcript_2886/g.5593  ORF Transcript_2886/g.5593 Transcript_2886/m.5593 type:complete len:202 (+) Transcript_2886:482-1087(+)
MRRVGSLDRLIQGGELGNRHHWTEDLLLHNCHVILDISEDCWLDEVALVSMLRSASLQRCPLRLSLLDVAHHFIELDLVDLRSLHARTKGPRCCAGLDWLQDLIHKSIIDRVLHEDPGGGDATLARIQEEANVCCIHCLLEITIFTYDHWGLTPTLQGHALHIGLCCVLLDQMSNCCGACKRNLVDVHVLCYGLTCILPEP